MHSANAVICATALDRPYHIELYNDTVRYLVQHALTIFDLVLMLAK